MSNDLLNDVGFHVAIALAAVLDQKGILPRAEFVSVLRLTSETYATDGLTDLAAALKVSSELVEKLPFQQSQP